MPKWSFIRDGDGKIAGIDFRLGANPTTSAVCVFDSRESAEHFVAFFQAAERPGARECEIEEHTADESVRLLGGVQAERGWQYFWVNPIPGSNYGEQTNLHRISRAASVLS